MRKSTEKNSAKSNSNATPAVAENSSLNLYLKASLKKKSDSQLKDLENTYNTIQYLYW